MKTCTTETKPGLYKATHHSNHCYHSNYSTVTGSVESLAIPQTRVSEIDTKEGVTMVTMVTMVTTAINNQLTIYHFYSCNMVGNTVTMATVLNL